MKKLSLKGSKKPFRGKIPGSRKHFLRELSQIIFISERESHPKETEEKAVKMAFSIPRLFERVYQVSSQKEGISENAPR